MRSHQKRANAGDFVCRAPYALFRFLLHQASERRQDGVGGGCTVVAAGDPSDNSSTPYITVTAFSYSRCSGYEYLYIP